MAEKFLLFGPCVIFAVNLGSMRVRNMCAQNRRSIEGRSLRVAALCRIPRVAIRVCGSAEVWSSESDYEVGI